MSCRVLCTDKSHKREGVSNEALTALHRLEEVPFLSDSKERLRSILLSLFYYGLYMYTHFSNSLPKKQVRPRRVQTRRVMPVSRLKSTRHQFAKVEQVLLVHGVATSSQ